MYKRCGQCNLTLLRTCEYYCMSLLAIITITERLYYMERLYTYEKKQYCTKQTDRLMLLLRCIMCM